MELKKAIINLLEQVADENQLIFFYALLRRSVSNIDTAEVLDEVFALRSSDPCFTDGVHHVPAE